MTYTDLLNPILARCEERLQHHQLTWVSEQPRFRIAQLKAPGSNRYCVLLTELWGSVVLTGDLRITDEHGVFSKGGQYDLTWFAANLQWDYLAGKFLKKQLIGKLAAPELQQMLDAEGEHWPRSVWLEAQTWCEELRQYEQVPLAEAAEYLIFLKSLKEYDIADVRDAYHADYLPGEVAWRCAVQRRFAALMHEGA